MKGLEHAARYLHALGGGLYLYTAGVLSRKHRPLLSEIARHFGYGGWGLLPPTTLPAADLAELAPAETPIQLRAPIGEDGNVTLYELVAIATLAAAARPEAVFEIGTFNGRTTLNLAANAPAAVVHTLDLPAEGADRAGLALDPDDLKYIRKPVSGAMFAGTPEESRIRQHFGDSATFDFAPFRGGVDVVFVDGAHSYDYVLNDSARAREMLRGGRGLILWHDYGAWAGVTRALNELHARGGEWAGMRHVRGTSVVCLRL